jgi:hypothetical protein
MRFQEAQGYLIKSSSPSGDVKSLAGTLFPRMHTDTEYQWPVKLMLPEFHACQSQQSL